MQKLQIPIPVLKPEIRLQKLMVPTSGAEKTNVEAQKSISVVDFFFSTISNDQVETAAVP